MPASTEQDRDLHSLRRAHVVDTVLIVGAAVGLLSAWLLRDSVDSAIVLVPTTALATLAMVRPWCRQKARGSIDTATWAIEREREHAMSAAATYAETWRAIVDTATEGIVTIDDKGRIETVNGAAEQMFGYTAGELLGRNVRSLMPQPYHDEHDGYLERYLRTGERRIIGIGREVMGLRKDGSTFPIDLSVGEAAVHGRRFFTSIIRDITERKELQTKLGQAERLAAVGELAAGVAHEINNPINTMINCAQLIQDGDDPHGNGKIIIEEGERIADIVRDLLQFARDDRALAQPTSLTEIVQRTLRLIGENWKRHGVTLTVDVAEELPAVHARPQQVQQVLLNLLINAKEALVQSGTQDRRVELSARPENGGVSCRVTDNGPGIEPDVVTRIFEPFVTTKRARGGTGLGLSITKSIAESYNGTVSVVSTPGQGATFTVWLPCAVPESGD